MPPLPLRLLRQFTPDPSLLSMLWTNAAPILVTLGLTGAIGIADIYLAGLIGKSAQAAVGIADQFLFFAVLLSTGLQAGTSACISRATGARQYSLARAYARDSIILAVLSGALAALIGCLFARHIIGFFTDDAAAARHGIPYLQLCALANLPWAVTQAQTAILRASGKALSCVWMWLAITAISIFGAVPFFCLPGILEPSLSALAIAWIGGAAVGVVFGCVLMRGLNSSSDQVRRFAFLPRVCHLLKVGIPVSIGEMCWLLSGFVTYKLLGSLPQGSELQAAWSIKFKIEEFVAIAPLLAISISVATIVGTKLGGHDRAGARLAVKQMTILATVLMLFAALALSAAACPLSWLFAHESSVARPTEWMLRLSPAVLPLMGLSLVLFAGIEGAGCAKIPMAATALALLAVRLPLSWSLALILGCGLAGIWLAGFISQAFLAAAAIVCFRKPGWDLPGLFGEIVAMQPLVVLSGRLEHDSSTVLPGDHPAVRRRRWR